MAEVPQKPRRLFLVAGEASGDRLGGALMAGLSELAPDTVFEGVGGTDMAVAGLTSLFPMSDLSVMGLAEIIPRYPLLRRRLHQTAKAVLAGDVDALITIDSPDFGLRVARLVKASRPDLPVIHYVAPSVWAWRPGRAQKMARYVDHVLALLPFEPPLMQAAGMSCDFTGHPVVARPHATEAEATAFRQTHAIKGPLLLMLPGSRKGELARLGPRFAATIAKVHAAVPGLSVVVPTLPHLVEDIRSIAPPEALIVTDASDHLAAFRAADAALAASGTVSLELAANETPMVIGYDMAPLSRWLLGRMLQVDTVTLVNLVSETRAVPEFLGRDCQPAPMAKALITLLRDPQSAAGQYAAMVSTMRRLGAGAEAPGLRAARSVLTALDRLQKR